MSEQMREECYAPIFGEHSLIEGIALSVIYYLLIAVLLPFYWNANVLCFIKKCQFFIRFCLRGNDNPNIPL